MLLKGAQEKLKNLKKCKSDAICLEAVKYAAMVHETGFGGSVDLVKAEYFYRILAQWNPGLALDSPFWSKKKNDSKWMLRRGPYIRSHFFTEGCRKFSVDGPGFWPAAGLKKSFDRELDVVVSVPKENSSWKSDWIGRNLLFAAERLADCNVRLRRAEFQVHTQCNVNDLASLREWEGQGTGAVIVQLMNDEESAKLKSAGAAGTATEDYVGIQLSTQTEDIFDGKMILAHELGHILGLNYHPADFPSAPE